MSQKYNDRMAKARRTANQAALPCEAEKITPAEFAGVSNDVGLY